MRVPVPNSRPGLHGSRRIDQTTAGRHQELPLSGKTRVCACTCVWCVCVCVYVWCVYVWCVYVWCVCVCVCVYVCVCLIRACMGLNRFKIRSRAIPSIFYTLRSCISESIHAIWDFEYRCLYKHVCNKVVCKWCLQLFLPWGPMQSQKLN
jgi:hypothetical protein